MRLLESVRLALATIRAQKLKSFFSMLGVLIGVTFLIAVVSIVQGMNVYMEERFANAIIGVNTFQVAPRPTVNIGNTTREEWLEYRRRPRFTNKDADYLEERLSVPAQISRESSDRATLEWRGKLVKDINLEAVEPSFFAIKKWEIASGRPFTAQEVRAGARVVVLGHLVADKLLKGVDPIGKELKIGGVPYRVVGIVAEQGTLFGLSLDKFAVVPYTSPAQRLVNPVGIIDQLNVQTNDATQMQAAIDEVEALMRARRNLRPDQKNNFHITTSKGALSTWEKISTILFAALPGLVAISLVVGGIVIMNIMLMAVTERTREIGIRKALGARRQDILAQFVVESATLSVAGATIGIGTGLALAFTVRTLSPLPAAVAPWSIGVGVTLGVLVGVVAGVYPASRAARLDPIAALRQE